MLIVDKGNVITKASVDVSQGLVHGHVYETSAKAVMREDEQHGLHQLVEFVQSLRKKPNT